MTNSNYTYNGNDLKTAYDLEDIGQFSIEESKWNDFTNEEFGVMGANVVNSKFNGDLGAAYDSVVRGE